MRDDFASPEMEPVSPYAYEAPTIRQRDPYKESRRGSLADRTAHLFENDEDDGIEDMAKWEEENLDPPKENGPIPTILKIAEVQKVQTEEEDSKSAEKEDKESDDFGKKVLMRIIRAQAKVERRWPGWTNHANCLDTGSDRFFPERGKTGKKAREMCSTCKVAHACLVEALEAKYEGGIWGGMTKGPRKEFGRVLKAGGTWDDVIGMRDEGFKDKDKITLDDAKGLANKKLDKIKKPGKKSGKAQKPKKAA